MEVQAADQFFAGDNSAFTASKWGVSGGPYTAAFVIGNTANFAVVNGTAAGAGGISVGGLNATENFTYSATASGTLLTGGSVVPVTVASGKTLDLGSTLSISSAAGVGFNKSGSGVFAMAGNTYNGGFTLGAGTFVARGANALGSGGTLTINGGTIAGSATRDFSGKFTGITVGGDFQLGALASAVAISADAANLTFNNTVSLGAATRTITIGGTGTYTLGGAISGSGTAGLTVNALAGASGTLSLTVANSYPGDTTVSSGVLTIGSDTATLGNGSGTLVLNGGTLLRASQTTAQTFANPISLTADSAIVGNPTSGSRTIPFSSSTVSGSAGTLTISNSATSGSGLLQVRFSGSFTFSRPVTVSKGFSGSGIMLQFFNSAATGDQTWSGLISGSGTLYKNVSSGAGGNVILSSGNTYTGGTEIRGGFFGLGTDNALGSGNVTVGFDSNPLGLFASGAARQLTNDITVDTALINSTNLQIKGSQNLTLSGRMLVHTNVMFFTISNTALTTFSGVVTNAAPTPAPQGIVKLGPGTMVLSGSNTFSGITAVNVGSLLVNNSSGSGTSTGAVLIASGGTLGGTGIITGPVTNNAGGTVQPGLGGTNTATLTISNFLSLAGSALFNLNRTNAQNASKISGLTTVTYGGTLTVTNIGPALQAGDTFTLFSAAAYAGGFSSVVLPALGTGLAWNTNNLSVNGSVSVFSTVTTLSLTNSLNPSGYLTSVNFTGTISPTNGTGVIIFLTNGTAFSTNNLLLGSATSASLASLPRGTNLITAIYTGNGLYLPSTNTLNQVVTNHPPVALDLATTRATGATTWKISVSDLLTNVTDADADALSLTSVSTSTNGAAPFIAGGYLLYTNTNLVTDQFTYNVSDGFGGTASALVNLTIGTSAPSGQAQSVVISGGTATLNFAGIPGFNYNVQRSTNLTDWATILTTNPVAGVFQCVDDFSDLGGTIPVSAYYRLGWNP